MTYHVMSCKWVFTTPDGVWEFTDRIPRGLLQWVNKVLKCPTRHTLELLRGAMGGSAFHQQLILETTGSYFTTVEEV